MGYQENSYENIPNYLNNFNGSSLFDLDVDCESIFQNVSEVQKYEYYDYYVPCYYNTNDSNKINESTGYSSNDDNSLTLKSSKDFKNILNPEKENIFIIAKKRPKEKSKKRIRPDDERTTFVRNSLNVYFNEKALNYVKEKYPYSKLKKFPTKFIAEVALVKNKYYLDKKLISLYEKSKLKKYEETVNRKKSTTTSKNKKMITLDEIKEEQGVKELLEKTFKELANEYLGSKKFKDYYKNLIERETKETVKIITDCLKDFLGKKILFNTLMLD